MSEDGVTLREVVDFAINLEKDGMSNYLKWAGMSFDADVQQLFTNLAMMEKEHIRLLANIRLDGDEGLILRSFEFIDLSRGMSSYPNPSSKNLKKILDYAINIELYSVNIYKKMHLSSRDEKVRTLLLNLIKEEEYHAYLLRQQESKILTKF